MAWIVGQKGLKRQLAVSRACESSVGMDISDLWSPKKRAWSFSSKYEVNLGVKVISWIQHDVKKWSWKLRKLPTHFIWDRLAEYSHWGVCNSCGLVAPCQLPPDFSASTDDLTDGWPTFMVRVWSCPRALGIKESFIVLEKVSRGAHFQKSVLSAEL